VIVFNESAMLLRSSHDCDGTTYTAGEAFVEKTGASYLPSNAGPGASHVRSAPGGDRPAQSVPRPRQC
jgi:hypothetical protein